MATVTNLINQFNAEDTTRLRSRDESRKPDIIVALERFLDDDRVVNFFLNVAADESEYDLARIEVFKVFGVTEFTDTDVRRRVGRVIGNVLLRSDDINVCNYAAMAAASYMDISEVSEEIERILIDRNQGSELRWNAFAAVKSNGAMPTSVEMLRSLLLDNEFRESAARVLGEWNVQ